MPNTTRATVFRGPMRAAAIQLFKTPDFSSEKLRTQWLRGAVQLAARLLNRARGNQA